MAVKSKEKIVKEKNIEIDEKVVVDLTKQAKLAIDERFPDDLGDCVRRNLLWATENIVYFRVNIFKGKNLSCFWCEFTNGKLKVEADKFNKF